MYMTLIYLILRKTKSSSFSFKYRDRGFGTIHRTFDAEVNNGKYSLSFQSAHSSNGTVYHLVPSKETDRIVVTTQLRSKHYCFKFGPEYTSESLKVLVLGVDFKQ